MKYTIGELNTIMSGIGETNPLNPIYDRIENMKVGNQLEFQLHLPGLREFILCGNYQRPAQKIVSNVVGQNPPTAPAILRIEAGFSSQFYFWSEKTVAKSIPYFYSWGYCASFLGQHETTGAFGETANLTKLAELFKGWCITMRHVYSAIYPDKRNPKNQLSKKAKEARLSLLAPHTEDS